MTLPALTGQNFVHTDPKLIFEIALGLESPKALFERYGYTETQQNALMSNEFFRRQIEAKSSELKTTGVVFRTKAALAAEDILEDVYIEAKNPDTPLPQKLDALKFFAKAAGVDAVQQQGTAAGGFSITLNLGDKTVTLSQEKIVNEE